MNDEERKLIEACKKQDPLAQKKLYEQYAPKMMAVCRRYMGSLAAAEDVFHDGFVKVLTKIDTFKGDSSIYTWIRTIMVHTALNALRANAVSKKYTQESTDTLTELQSDDEIFAGFTTKELLDSIASLPDMYRTIFNMREVEGYEYDEIADTMGMTESYARVCLARAKNMLRKKLKGHYD
ncbi:MAG: RNA polymerase sigma factor [Bacteroidales bacterium]|nr:RNA polymerase sigma factor [Bacteroidales bacterium]